MSEKRKAKLTVDERLARVGERLARLESKVAWRDRTFQQLQEHAAKKDYHPPTARCTICGCREFTDNMLCVRPVADPQTADAPSLTTYVHDACGERVLQGDAIGPFVVALRAAVALAEQAKDDNGKG